MDRFDKEAAEWDSNPDILIINQQIATLIIPPILVPEDTVLEVGCGTGILTFSAQQLVSRWHGIDTSPGMIAAFEAKLPKFHIPETAVSAEVMYLESSNQFDESFDWAVSAMTFHHIPDMAGILEVLAKVTKKGIIVVDYLAWDGSRVFHPESKMDGVCRHGIDKSEITRMCHAAGFREVHAEIAFTLPLKRDGKDVPFPFLKVVARH